MAYRRDSVAQAEAAAMRQEMESLRRRTEIQAKYCNDMIVGVTEAVEMFEERLSRLISRPLQRLLAYVVHPTESTLSWSNTM